MKKEYIFIAMISIILYLAFLILNYIYKEHQINNTIETMRYYIYEIEEKIDSTKNIIEYKTSKAYKNKILKEQQSLKNIGETVIYFTTEQDYNKYTTIEEVKKEEEIIVNSDGLEAKIKDLNVYEKWMYFLFKKHPDFDA